MRIQRVGPLYADIAQIAPITVEPTIDAIIVAGEICQSTERTLAALRPIAPVHTSFDYRLGQAPVLCNRPGCVTEHHASDLVLVVEVGQ